MPASIRFRWDPQAVDCLLQLEDEGRADEARRIVQEIRGRLGRQPGIYRVVRITGLAGPRSRRLTAVQRVYLGDRLPYLVYYRYQRADGLVHVLRIRHARQKPIER